MAPMDQFILFGDSITQNCFNQERGFAFGAALADIYARKLDIVNRGLSGYNTTQAFQALPMIMPDPAHAKVRLMAIFFGANDARIAGSPGGPDQSVPVEDFVHNLRGMVNHPAVRQHQGIRIILIMTPPIDERLCTKDDQEKYPGIGRVLRRTAANTAKYAQAVRTLGEELGLPVVDIHAAMLARAGYNSSTASTPAGTPSGTSDNTLPENVAPTADIFWDSGEGSSNIVGSLASPPSVALQSYLHDGLHFSGEGYKLLYGELMHVIEEHYPDQMPQRLPFVLPRWDDERAWGDKNLLVEP